MKYHNLPSILAVLLGIGRHVLFFQPSIHGHRLAQHVLQLYLIDWWENSGFGHCTHGRASSVMPHDHPKWKIIQISDRHVRSSRTIVCMKRGGMPRLSCLRTHTGIMLIRENSATAPITNPIISSRGIELSAMSGGSYGFWVQAKRIREENKNKELEYRLVVDPMRKEK